MKIRDFLALVYEGLKADLRGTYRRHQWRIRWSLLQVFFDSPGIHYEVWVRKKTGRIEIGLHFESPDVAENYRWASALALRMVEVQARLGPSVELEEWTKAWTRLHESRAFDGKLSEALAGEVSERLAAFIATLEPIVEEERVAAVR